MIVKIFILLFSHSGARPACSAASHSVRGDSVRPRPSTHRLLLSPPPISPIAAPSEDQKEHEDDKNEIHSYLQEVWREVSLLYMWCRITIRQPRILPTTILTGAAMRLHPISIFSLPA